jgi:hypothetical protein
MREAAAGLTPFRRLLRRLRDIMAADLPAEERLQQTVALIAADMVAEVCSVYVMRAGEVLELFATRGLRAEGHPQNAAAGRRRSCWRHRRACAAAGAGGRAITSQFRLPSGDW